jgi:hypothetical protein
VTWYGWNLRAPGVVTFARMHRRHCDKKRRNPRLKMRHPWIRRAMGGLWKPLSLQGSEYLYRWKKSRVHWL